MDAVVKELAPVVPLPARTRPWHGRRMTWLLAVLAAGLLVAVGTAIDLARRTSRPSPPLLLVAPVTRGLVTASLPASGVLEPVQTAVISQPVAGRLVQVSVRPGQRVSRGQILARFDPLGLQAEFVRAEARVVAAEVANLEAEVKLIRLDRRFERGAETPEQADDQADVEQIMMARAASAAAELAAREAAYRLAGRRLAARVVRAPAEGVVLTREVAEGQMVAEGGTLFRLTPDPTRLQITTSVPEANLAQVKVGQEVRFSVPAFPGLVLTGRIADVAPLTGPENDRRLPLSIRIESPTENLRPGMTARLNIQTASDRSVVRVPTAAVLFAPLGTPSGFEEPAVWLTTAGSNRLERVPVALALTDGSFAEVRSPRVREGDAVAVGYATVK
jgi:HlyD family secretion protein